MPALVGLGHIITVKKLMTKNCKAIAKSTNEPCKKKAVPGSCYCLFHIEKTPLICGALIGVLLSYLFNWILPSPELTELQRLRDDVKPVISLVETSFPSLERSKAIEKLMGDYKQLQEEVQAEKNTLHSLSSRLIVTFSGEWDSDPYPRQLMSPVNHEYYVELVGPDQKIKFYASEVYTFKTIAANRAQFSSSQAVKDGAFPLGAQIDTLESFSQINIFVPFFLGDSIQGGQIVVEQINMTFSINGIECNPLVIEQDQEVSLTGKKPNIWAILAMKVDQATTKLFQDRTYDLKPDVSP